MMNEYRKYCNFCKGSTGGYLWVSYPRPRVLWFDCGKCNATGIHTPLKQKEREK